MTSTPFTIGLNGTERRSSRVLAPPGGGHTDIFGGDPEPPRGRRRAPNAHATTVTTSNGAENNGQGNSEASTPEPAPANEPPVKTVTKTEPQQPATEAPKRVRVPPGGFSSGLW